MELLLPSLYIFILVSLPSFIHSQQTYFESTQLGCNNATSMTANGFPCNAVNDFCNTYVTFRSLSPYDSPSTIATLLSSDSQDIAMINHINPSDKIPTDTLITVPVNCSCSGDFFRHYTTYTVKEGDTPFSIANDTYQGLTTIQALKDLNPNSRKDLHPRMKLKVPLTCACPINQAESDVFLLTYVTSRGDSLDVISKRFGVEMQSILSANSITDSCGFSLFTPVLVPLSRYQMCTDAPGSYLCFCRFGGYIREWREDDPRCRLGTKTSSIKSAIPTGKMF